MGRWSEGRDGKGGIGMVKGGEEVGTGRWSECRDGEGGNGDREEKERRCPDAMRTGRMGRGKSGCGGEGATKLGWRVGMGRRNAEKGGATRPGWRRGEIGMERRGRDGGGEESGWGNEIGMRGRGPVVGIGRGGSRVGEMVGGSGWGGGESGW
ncbi:hypothetical protein CBR_g51216 [Chara braunii]|uniref:Uncharacterized protein n=1 Tax=Chara braunii TaxID=69332 RepID=A0A388M7Z3_CHABU|nr:hypothetical protein CBR_g51216 [Chara braunii]|eukprot:GBG90707.1 hypothetical protein CBR_g51216 [Chara braunii]